MEHSFKFMVTFLTSIKQNKMKKQILTFVFAIASILSFGQSNTYFHDRIDTTIYATTTGTNTYTGTNADPNFNVARYLKGLLVSTFIVHGNTGAATFKLVTKTGTLSTVAIKKQNGAALSSGDIPDSSAIFLLYYGSFWRLVGMHSAPSNFWSIIGNSGTIAGTNFQGTIDSVDAVYKTNNIERMRILANGGKVGIGTSSPSAKLHIKSNDTLFANYAFNVTNNNSINNLLFRVRDKPGFLEAGNSITHNLFFGLTAGLQYDTTIANRCDNIGIGECLDSLKDATDNIGMGYGTLKSNKHSPHNVAIGTGVLNSYAHDLNHGDNTGIGTDVMFLNTNGFQNTFFGSYSGYNIKGNYNVGVGYYAMNNILNSILQGDENVAIGIRSLTNISNFSNSNTAIGSYSGENLGSNQAHNGFFGYEAGRHHTSATGMIIIGTYDYLSSSIEESRSPIVIQSNATDSSQQTIRINGVLNIQGGTGIDATASDASTINKTAGRFRKDTSGSIYTLTNSYITPNSIIIITLASDPGTISTHAVYVTAGNGSATFTWQNDPTNNSDVNFFIIN